VSAILFGIGALVAVLLLPSRRRLAELRNSALVADAAPAARAVPTDSRSAEEGLPAADPR
jgi:hypothetical protein